MSNSMGEMSHKLYNHHAKTITSLLHTTIIPTNTVIASAVIISLPLIKVENFPIKYFYPDLFLYLLAKIVMDQLIRNLFKKSVFANTVYIFLKMNTSKIHIYPHLQIY